MHEWWPPLAILASSGLTGTAIFFVSEDRQTLRGALNMFGATVKLLLVVFLVWGVSAGHNYEARMAFFGDFDLVLRVDALSLLFVGLSSTLWFLTTIYAIGYLEGSPHRSRFFGFFSFCVTATMGIAMAGNLITFIVFYELLTIATYPLVVHRGTPASLDAGRTYLVYLVSGGLLVLAGAIWLHVLAGPVEFGVGGVLGELTQTHPWELRAIFVLLVAGFGFKAALVPLHGWLPKAMVAPAPVSALLHAVAVVKAGAFGIIRVAYDLYGIEEAAALDLLTPLAVIASITIIYGSIRALMQDEIKKRLAFSTVSQLSYIMLGVGMIGPLATTGALVHLVHQGVMKITLFFCAGNLAETLGIHHVHEMNGVGRRMPITMTAFTVAGIGMIGLPPMAGFISKWYLGLGALGAGEPWAIVVLALSGVLNAAYFLPPVYAAWFKKPERDWDVQHPHGVIETQWMLLIAPVGTAALVIGFGLLASFPFSPVGLAERVIEEGY